MNTEEFRHYGHLCIDWLADFFEHIKDLPVTPALKPGDIKKSLPDQAPELGESMDVIFDDFLKKILPGMTHWQHPRWFAYFPANNSPESVLGELLSAGLGAQCMIWQTSPAAEELEEQVMDWLKKMLHLPSEMRGVIQDTASTATLCALIAAREKKSDYAINERGFSDNKFIVYTSTESHSSLEKGAKIAGFGKNNIRLIPVDDSYAMKAEEFERQIQHDIECGSIPTCLSATVGTTSSSALDPLAALGPICRKYNIWFHVDAAYAGSAAILPEKRYILDGVEYADSFVFNPHKWLLTNFDCSAFFVRSADDLVRSLAIHPEYLKTGVDAEVNNYRDWGIQLGRRFRALKLWFVLRSYGTEGLQQMLRSHIQWAGQVKEWIEKDDRFQLLAPVPLSLVCFRYFNERRGDAALNTFNERLLKNINKTGKVFMTHTVLRGMYTLRMVIGQRTTTFNDVAETWELIQSETKKLEGDI